MWRSWAARGLPCVRLQSHHQFLQPLTCFSMTFLIDMAHDHHCQGKKSG